jgi:hypothetical protein
MQKCLNCGREIRFVATGPNKSVVCDAEKLPFVTENGRQVFGYLLHNCNKTEDEHESSGKENNN